MLSDEAKGKKRTTIFGEEFVIHDKLFVQDYRRLATCIGVIEMGDGQPHIWETDLNYREVEATAKGKSLLRQTISIMDMKYSDRFMELFKVELGNIIMLGGQKKKRVYRLMSFIATIA